MTGSAGSAAALLYGSVDTSPFGRTGVSGTGCLPGEVSLSTGCLNLDVDPATAGTRSSTNSSTPGGSTNPFK